MSERADEMPDSAEDDDWLTFVGITRRIIEAEVELRDIAQIINATNFKIGDMGQLQFDVLPGSALTGLADRTAYERFSANDLVVVGINPTLTHGDLASGTFSLRGTNASEQGKIQNTLSGGGSTVFEVHVGDTGTITWIAPSATGGGDTSMSLANCVCTGAEITATHGGRLERRFTFRAYSSDGQTSPLSVT
jgi:hypothetical protein